MEEPLNFESLPESEARPEAPGRKGLRVVAAVLSLALTLGLLAMLLQTTHPNRGVQSVNTDIPDLFGQYLSGQLNATLEGLIPTKRIYKLSDRDLAAPEPDQARYGETKNISELQWLFDEAAELLDGQSTLFTPKTAVRRGSKINYYLDETILAITWRQVMDDCEYTFTEIKITHPTQIRRYLSGGTYDSGVLHKTTEMSDTVNAVVASAGDYYAYRKIGVVVNNGTVYRAQGRTMDTCYIDENGDLLFTKRRELADEEAVKRFVEENNVRFSLSFGPLLLRDGKYSIPGYYPVGEIDEEFARSAICQLDKLHYVLVTANIAFTEQKVPTIAQFARSLKRMGIPTAYALDGGQTATITMNDKLMNRVSYGAEREISDIIYFATAIPNEGN